MTHTKFEGAILLPNVMAPVKRYFLRTISHIELFSKKNPKFFKKNGESIIFLFQIPWVWIFWISTKVKNPYTWSFDQGQTDTNTTMSFQHLLLTMIKFVINLSERITPLIKFNHLAEPSTMSVHCNKQLKLVIVRKTLVDLVVFS